MDFKDQVKQLAARIETIKEQLQTEEATKNAFIMPMMMALGYDVFNPMEVVPEYVCDVGIKKGEKIDYAIMKEGKPIILIECKHWAGTLDLHSGQLLRYFHVSKAKFGILTNGIVYRFYTDLKEPNKMDEKPFFEIDLCDLRENQIDELKKFHKSYYDLDNILSTASDLQYTNVLKSIIKSELINPSDPFVRLLAKQAYQGFLTAKIVEYFTELVKKSFNSVISDMITERLKTALQKENAETSIKPDSDVAETTELKDDGIETTLEELESYYIVKSILSPYIDVKRVVYRDTKAYLGIILDDTNRKPICRLYLNGTKKYLVTFGEGKTETKHMIEAIDDLYSYKDPLVFAAKMYDSK